jgi:hypothetical protein
MKLKSFAVMVFLLVLVCGVANGNPVKLVAFAMFAQSEVFPPVVNSDMIEISFDSTTWQNASQYVQDIVIKTGIAPTQHITHHRRGEVRPWAYQLGVPNADKYVQFSVNTANFPSTENKYFIKGQFGHEDPQGSGLYRLAPMSEPSLKCQMTGKPGGPKHISTTP